MQVILNEDVVSLGIEGDVINVADGYARNYLIPKGLAVKATPGNLKNLEFRRKAIQKKEAARKAEVEKYAKKFEGKTIKALVKVAEEGKLYGSVTISDVAGLLKEQLNEEVDKRQIVIHDHIKEVGKYEVIVRLHPEVEATLKLEVVPEEEPDAKVEEKGKEQAAGDRKRTVEKTETEQAEKLDEDDVKKAKEENISQEQSKEEKPEIKERAKEEPVVQAKESTDKPGKTKKEQVPKEEEKAKKRSK